MAWQTPKTDWVSADVIGNSDLNRIEGNLLEVADISGSDGQLGQNVTGTLDVGELADIVNVGEAATTVNVGEAATTVNVGKAGETVNLLGDVPNLTITNDLVVGDRIDCSSVNETNESPFITNTQTANLFGSQFTLDFPAVIVVKIVSSATYTSEVQIEDENLNVESVSADSQLVTTATNEGIYFLLPGVYFVEVRANTPSSSCTLTIAIKSIYGKTDRTSPTF